MSVNILCSSKTVQDSRHRACPGTVPDVLRAKVDGGWAAIPCACSCHAFLALGCEQGFHDECIVREDLGREKRRYRICDCPCHHLELRSAYLKLHARAVG